MAIVTRGVARESPETCIAFLIVFVIVFASSVFFEDQLRHEQRAFEIRQRVAETLRRVHAAQRVEIGGRVFADAHWVAQTSVCGSRHELDVTRCISQQIAAWNDYAKSTD